MPDNISAHGKTPNVIDLNMPFLYEAFRDNTKVVSCGLRIDRPSSCLHLHSAVEFIYVASGSGDVTIGDQVYPIKAGQLAAISSFVPHDYIGTHSESYLVLIPVETIPGAARELDSKTFRHSVIDDKNGELLALFQLLLSITRSETGTYASIPMELRNELAAQTASVLVRSAIALCKLADRPPSGHIILRAVEYINTHFREPLRVSELAGLLYCNQYTLSSQFSRTFGMSINEYINRLRAAEVNRLLTETPDMTLYEAAERSGFGSQRSLYRAYTEVFGKSPRENRGEKQL